VVSTLVGMRPDAPGGAVAFSPLPGGGWDGLTVRGFRVAWTPWMCGWTKGMYGSEFLSSRDSGA